MARFLVSLTYTPHLKNIYSLHLYKLKYASTPDDVTLPENTFFFAFWQSPCDSTEELKEKLSMNLFSFSNTEVMANFSIRKEYLEHAEHYFVGKEVTVNDCKGVYNEKISLFIPFDYLNCDNYKVIDF